MSNNDFLEKIRYANSNYTGKLKSITFIVKLGAIEKKIFKWFFKANDIDFYISFPYFKSETYHCGIVEMSEKPSSEDFDAVKNGRASKVPVKFSYHQDGQVHFKPSNLPHNSINPWEKLAELKAKPLTELEGGHIFDITFEGLSKFENVKKHKNRNGERECILEVPQDIINFKIQAFAASTQEGVDNQIKPGSTPWFQVSGTSKLGQPVIIGVYAVLSRETHILDDNKNGLTAVVGFDRTNLKKSGKTRSLYLFAR